MLEYRQHDTALLLVDPYIDFLAEDGKVWPRVREVADAVQLHQHLRELVDAAGTTGLAFAIAPHRRYRPGDR